MNKIGYARVSTAEQNLDLQIHALKDAGCTRIFTDKGVSGAREDRDGLSGALSALNSGDALIIWKLDRLGRSIQHLLRTVSALKQRGVTFQSLNDSIDTSCASGTLQFHMMAAFAEFERALIGERTRAGMKAARAEGKALGRPRILSPDVIEHARMQIVDQGASLPDLAKTLGVNRSTLWRALQDNSLDDKNSHRRDCFNAAVGHSK